MKNKGLFLGHKNKVSILSKTIILIAMLICATSFLSGCAFFKSEVAEMEGSIKGNTYIATFYSNEGEKFMQVSGQQIDMNENIVKERTYSSEGGWGYTNTISSVLTLTIDGNSMSSCGSTIIFAEEGLEPDIDYKKIEKISSETDGSLGDYTFVANVVNEYKNMIGKPVAVIIQSQLGDPICSYSGEKVYWEVCQDLPKTTKLMIDGKLLYIHRANFQIIDEEMLD